MEEKFYEMTKDLPQLILAMDTNDGNGQYVLIQNAKEDETYYCPCCGGEVKPRAYKKDKEYQVQPHFYHINGGCTEESYIHYVCKMLLTKKNCKFKVGDKEYSVKSVDVEKTYDTKFGKYRPDVTIVTKEDKVFFAEIAHTSQKTQEYLPKWDELGNDVIEIKSNEFINVIVENKIPSFKLIYSNGQCFVKSSLHEDYTKFIYKRKEDWKRQDLLNYKIQWERLDWFFIKLQDYKLGKTSYKSMLDSFKQVDRVDKPLLFDLIKKQSCLKGEKQQFRDIINNEMDKYFQEKVDEYKKKYNGIVISGNLEPKIQKNIFKISFCDLKDCKEVFGGTRRWVNDISLIDELFSNIENVIKENITHWKYLYYSYQNEKLLEKFEEKNITPIVNEIKEYIKDKNYYRFGNNGYLISDYCIYREIYPNIKQESEKNELENDINQFCVDEEYFNTCSGEKFKFSNYDINKVVSSILIHKEYYTEVQHIEQMKKYNKIVEMIKLIISNNNNKIKDSIWNISIEEYSYEIEIFIKIDTNYDYRLFNRYFSKTICLKEKDFINKNNNETMGMIKNKLLEAMIEIKDNFNKLDGTNYHYRRFIVDKEEI
jgi:hypothetical protein